MALNRIILFGRLTKDPEYKQLSSGASVCKFTVACDRGFVNKQTNERESDFIECQAWRGAADFAARWFHKGDAITVEGSLRNNNWTDNDGKKHYSYISDSAVASRTAAIRHSPNRHSPYCLITYRTLLNSLKRL